MPSADFCTTLGEFRNSLSLDSGTAVQISRGKFGRLRRTTAGFTLCALDGHGLRSMTPARPALTPRLRFLFIGSRLCSTLPSDITSRENALALG